MTADDIILRMRAAGIGCDEDRIRRDWRMNQSQATDRYLAMPRAEQEAVCLRAIQHVGCEFCGAPAGRGCSLRLQFPLGVLDWFAHCGRWMKYIQDEAVYEMLGPPVSSPSAVKWGAGPGMEAIADVRALQSIEDLLG